MAVMKNLLALVIFTSLVAHRTALRCHSCIAASEADCQQQGSHSCPWATDACVTIVATGSIIKSCSYKSFCDEAWPQRASGTTVECCFSDNCNGSQRSTSAGPRSTEAVAPFHWPVLLAAVVGTLLPSLL